MRQVLKRFAVEPYERPKDPFTALARSIIFQQISGKAASAILGRFLALFPGGKPTPAALLKLRTAQLRKAGLSNQKVLYLRDLAKRFLDGTIEPRKFPKMTDEEIREHLLVVKGIGRWTADMFLMFTLHRPDVLPTGDLAIQKGFQKVFNMRALPDAKKMEKLARDWSPHRTVASLYLWRVVDDGTFNW
jgi:DNA-3-methyladenine glycosylase II